MATVSIQHLPVDVPAMANRRAPLADVPNGINSPFRGIPTTNTASIKRTRAQAGDQREVVLGQPPYKKQVIELVDSNVENVDPKKRSAVAVIGHDKQDELFTRRRTNAPPTEFTQRLTAVSRERRTAPVQQQPQHPSQSRVEQTQKTLGDNNLETVRQWQRHYRRQFPTFVFYFDNVPEDVRLKAAAQFRTLGARELRFFDRAVTHIVTTRSVPPESTTNANEEDSKLDSAQPKTVRPSSLTQDQRRTTDLLDANLQRRSQNYATAGTQNIDPRRIQGSGNDVLIRARSMKIKIWALEKLQRVLKTMLETDAGDQDVYEDAREQGAAGRTTMKQAKDADLEQLLRNEKVNGPADRDMTVAAQDMVAFKGCYIYIHDMDERTKPVMVRDYPKPQTKEQGQWPQFRLTPAGRCPFLEESTNTKKAHQQTHDNQNAKAEQELAAQRKTRAAADQNQTRPLAEREANLRRSPRKTVQLARAELSKPLDPPKIIPTKRQSSMDGMPRLFNSAQQSLRGPPRMIGGEPVASGLQQSNITSAIRSQVISSAAISSTAAGMPKRVGDTKEVSALKRKVLERGANVTSIYSMPSSYMNDVRAAINDQNDPPPRAAKRRAQETLGAVQEDDEDGQNSRPGRRSTAKRRKPMPKEAKPGYCENCRDKFEDFDEHVNSRKHRKFALTKENWLELDELLCHLKRPHKVAQ